MKKHLLTLIALFALTSTTIAVAAEPWQTRLKQQLPLLGHRNWIVVADSAYPLQTAPGIETICADAGQVTVVKEVLAARVVNR